MNIMDQSVTDQYAIYNGDCIQVMKGVPSESIHLSIYSPPFFAGYSIIRPLNTTCRTAGPTRSFSSITNSSFRRRIAC